MANLRALLCFSKHERVVILEESGQIVELGNQFLDIAGVRLLDDGLPSVLYADK